jgi:plasmid stabilization system protein ParE
VKAFFTDAALADLADIARHIGRDSVPAARRFTAALRSRALGVARNPRLYPYADGLEGLGVRRRLYRDYLILYRERAGQVEIVHIVHGAMDWTELVEDFAP